MRNTLSRSAAAGLAESWVAAGWAVDYYPSGFTSRSRNVRIPVLVATRDGWTRQVFKSGPMRETTPDGDSSWVTLAPIAGVTA